MEPEGGGEGGFSPRATVEDIQRRLLRPSPLRSPLPTPSFSFSRSKYAQGRNLPQIGEAASKKRKLEDYLDPVLLSAVSSKIGRAEKKVRKIAMKREVRDFEWPADELRMLMEEAPVGKEKIDSVNLGNDSDNLTDEDGVDKFSTPFQKFEHTALALFEL